MLYVRERSARSWSSNVTVRCSALNLKSLIMLGLTHLRTVHSSGVYTTWIVWLKPDFVGMNRCSTLSDGLSRTRSKWAASHKSELLGPQPTRSKQNLLRAAWFKCSTTITISPEQEDRSR